MTEIEETIRQLKNHGNGAHAHTANKCSYYLELINSQTDEKVNLRGRVLKKQEWIDELSILAKKSMETNDWKELQTLMKFWW
jgi:hypothetical protein